MKQEPRRAILLLVTLIIFPRVLAIFFFDWFRPFILRYFKNLPCITVCYSLEKILGSTENCRWTFNVFHLRHVVQVQVYIYRIYIFDPLGSWRENAFHRDPVPHPSPDCEEASGASALARVDHR